MSQRVNHDGTITFYADDGVTAPTTIAAGQTGAQVQTAYVTYQGTWNFALFQALQLAAAFAYMRDYVSMAALIDGGTSTSVTATQFGTFWASVANNYRTIKASIQAATTSAQVAAISITAGYPANP